MKVLQVLPELNSGGVERGTLELGAYLVAQGHESHVLSNGGRLVRDLESQGTTHHTLPVHKKSLLSLTLIPRLTQLLIELKPDVLHLRSRVPAWLCYLAWKRLPIDSRPHLVTTVHGLYSVNFYSEVMTKGERVICVSKTVQDYVLKNYPRVAGEKLTIVNRGVDTSLYHPDYKPDQAWQQQWLENYPQFKDKVLLLLPGRITRIKGHEDFLTLIADLRQNHPNIHGVIAGGPSPKKEAYLAELHEKATALQLDDHLTFLGHRSDLKEVIAACDITISFTQVPESFGRVTLEALTLGKPVVAYAHGGVAEQLDLLFPCGKVSLGDPSAASSLISSWLDNPPPAPAPNTQFTLEKMCRKIVTIYQELESANKGSK